MNSKLYVGNLPWSATEDSIKQTFESVGTVKEVKMVMDRDSGRFRGFSFVTMGSGEEAQKAVDTFDGADMDGRPMKVNEATEKPKTDYRRS